MRAGYRHSDPGDGRPGAQSRSAGHADRRHAPELPESAGAARRPSRIGLALAGGGPLGGIYEIGALAALSESLDGVDFNDLDVYVGVSAGGFVAASLVNGISPRQMVRKFIDSGTGDGIVALRPESLLRPAFAEYGRRAASVPALLLTSIWQYLTHPASTTVPESFLRLTRAIPAGAFDNAGIDTYLRSLFSKPGRTNDFRRLKHRLFLVATDLDSGKAVPFGSAGYDDVPISTAVQASAALPGLYPPVEIDGHHYVDGALKKTMHASIALKQGADLVFCINPLVPFDADLAARRGMPRRPSVTEGGLPVVLAQTFRSIIHSRMLVGLEKYRIEYPNADIVLFEPTRDDAEMFFTNVFGYRGRRRLSEHAYQRTRIELFRRRHELAPIFARHGIRIRLDVLRDHTRTLGARWLRQPGLRLSQAGAVTHRLVRALDDLDRWLDRNRIAPRRAA